MKKNRPTPTPSCASCDLPTFDRAWVAEAGKSSKGCPTFTRKTVLEDANKEYEVSEVRNFARQASIQEAECYANRHQRHYVMQPTKTRIVEICEFAKKMGYTRLGLAFCLDRSQPSCGHLPLRNVLPKAQKPIGHAVLWLGLKDFSGRKKQQGPNLSARPSVLLALKDRLSALLFSLCLAPRSWEG